MLILQPGFGEAPVREIRAPWQVTRTNPAVPCHVPGRALGADPPGGDDVPEVGGALLGGEPVAEGAPVDRSPDGFEGR